MTKIKQLEQSLKVEKQKEKLKKEEAALEKLNAIKVTKNPRVDEPLKEYKSDWINASQDFIDMLKNNVEGIMTGVIVIFIVYILFK